MWNCIKPKRKGVADTFNCKRQNQPQVLFPNCWKNKTKFSATTTDRNSAIFVLTKPVKCLVFRSFFDQKLREISISNVTQPQITFGKTENWMNCRLLVSSVFVSTIPDTILFSWKYSIAGTFFRGSIVSEFSVLFLEI